MDRLHAGAGACAGAEDEGPAGAGAGASTPVTPAAPSWGVPATCLRPLDAMDTRAGLDMWAESFSQANEDFSLLFSSPGSVTEAPGPASAGVPPIYLTTKEGDAKYVAMYHRTAALALLADHVLAGLDGQRHAPFLNEPNLWAILALVRGLEGPVPEASEVDVVPMLYDAVGRCLVRHPCAPGTATDFCERIRRPALAILNVMADRMDWVPHLRAIDNATGLLVCAPSDLTPSVVFGACRFLEKLIRRGYCNGAQKSAMVDMARAQARHFTGKCVAMVGLLGLTLAVGEKEPGLRWSIAMYPELADAALTKCHCSTVLLDRVFLLLTNSVVEVMKKGISGHEPWLKQWISVHRACAGFVNARGLGPDPSTLPAPTRKLLQKMKEAVAAVNRIVSDLESSDDEDGYASRAEQSSPFSDSGEGETVVAGTLLDLASGVEPATCPSPFIAGTLFDPASVMEPVTCPSPFVVSYPVPAPPSLL